MKIDQLNNQQQAQQPGEVTGLNIKEFLIKCYHYLWLFILMLVVAIFCGWLYLRYTPPKYSVSATLLIRNDSRAGGAQDVFSDLKLYRENTNKQNELQILKSRKLMTRVVNTLGLQYSYYVVGNVKTTNLYDEAPFELQFIPPIDSAHALRLEVHLTGPNKFRIGEKLDEYEFGQVITLNSRKFRIIQKDPDYYDSEYKEHIIVWLPLENAASSVLGGLEVSGAEDLSSVLTLTYFTENPKLGADILNTLMKEYNETGVEDKNQTNRKIISFIDDRLKRVESQLGDIEKDIQQYKTNNDVIDLSTQSGHYFNTISEVTQNIQKEELKIQVAELMEDYLRDSTRNLSLVPSTLGLDDNTLQELTTGYNKLLSTRATEIQTGATVNSPVVKGLDREIDEARKKLLRNLVNIKDVYRGTINALQSQNKEYKGQLAAVPQKEKESRERLRQQEIKQNLYLYLLQKMEESSIAQASVIADSRVIDEALKSGKQVGPNSLRIYMIAFFAGLLIPVIIVYIIDVLNDRVTTRSDITRVTEIPIVAEIGHSKDSETLLFPNRSRTVVAEQIRILRSNLRFLLLDKQDQNTILVTSSYSGEGKSFISINLGSALALSGKKTVILEFDLRKPKILAGLGLPKSNGLTNYLVGSTSLTQLVQPVPIVENLFVIPSGPIPPNPSEILLSEKMPELFAWLKENFDVIVIDTAPVGLVSDSLTLSQYADLTLYIIRQRYTYKKQVHFIKDIFEQKKLPNMGLVVNDVVAEGVKSYYGYGGGRYGYGYGYGYGAHNGYYEDQKTGYISKWRKKWTKRKA
jgi:tyrosine-protein kinase Etk/Wzc